MEKNRDTLSRREKKKEDQKTLKIIEGQKKIKVWLNKIFISNPN